MGIDFSEKWKGSKETKGQQMEGEGNIKAMGGGRVLSTFYEEQESQCLWRMAKNGEMDVGHHAESVLEVWKNVFCSSGTDVTRCSSSFHLPSRPSGTVLSTVVLILCAPYSPPVSDLQGFMSSAEITGSGVGASASIIRILSASYPHFVSICFIFFLTSLNSHDFNYHLCVRMLKLKPLSQSVLLSYIWMSRKSS